MKKKCKIFLIAFVSILITLALLHIVSINTKSFKKDLANYNVEVFVPDGRADRYKNLVPLRFIGMDWKIYEYRLDSKEAEEIEKELDGDFWTKLESENKEHFLRDFFYATYLEDKPFTRIWKKDFTLSDEVYVSSYTGYQQPFHYSETAIFDNWRIFIYDKGNSTYYGLDIYLAR